MAFSAQNKNYYYTPFACFFLCLLGGILGSDDSLERLVHIDAGDRRGRGLFHEAESSRQKSLKFAACAAVSVVVQPQSPLGFPVLRGEAEQREFLLLRLWFW